MSPRIVHIPLSGGDRKAQAKEIRRAHGLHTEFSRQAAIARGEAAAKLREAHRLECLAWNAIMFCGGPAQPSPTLRVALNAGFDHLEVCCNKCGRTERLDLKLISRPGRTPIHVLEASLFCQQCSSARKWGRQRAHIIGLVNCEPSGPEAPRAVAR